MVDFNFTDSAMMWAVQTAAAGATVFGLGWVWLACVSDPARRQALAAWLVRGALLVAVLSLLPAWLVLPVLPQSAVGPAGEPAVVVAEAAPVRAEPAREAAVAPGIAEIPCETPTPTEELAAPLAVALPEEPAPQSLILPSAAVDNSREGAVESTAALRIPAQPAAPWEPPASPWPGIARLLFLAYAFGIAAASLPLVLGALALARLRRQGRPASPHVQSHFDALASGLQKRPRLLLVERLSSPVCFGLFRPVVLLPRKLASRATEAELRWVFAHELDHLRRGDPRIGWCLGIARMLYFVVPWFWAVRRDLVLSQEYLADAAAAAAGGQVEDYAAFLVRLSNEPGRRRHPVGAAAVRANQSDLFRRVTMLLASNERRGTRVSRWWTATVAAGAIGSAAVLSGIGFAQERTEPQPKPRVERRAEVQPEPRRGDEPQRREVERVEVRVQPPVAVPPEIAALRKAVDEAEKRGADVTQIRKELETLEKSMAARRVVVVEGRSGQPLNGARGVSAEPQPRRVDPADAARDDARRKAEAELLRAKAAQLKANGQLREAEELAARADALAKQAATENRRIAVEAQPGLGGARAGVGQGSVFSASGVTIEPRLGVQVEAIPPALGVQLDLPRGQGVVVSAMFKDFPADKAGLKTGDILLEFDGKPVSDSPVEFLRAVGAVKAGDKVDAVILRKGKKESIKGIEVPEAKRGAAVFPGGRGEGGFAPARPVSPVPALPSAGVRPVAPAAPPAFRGGGRGGSSSVQVQVGGGGFKLQAEDDGVKYDITGTVGNGKADPTRIAIIDGAKEIEATSVEKVPAPYRERVEKLLDSVRVTR